MSQYFACHKNWVGFCAFLKNETVFTHVINIKIFYKVRKELQKNWIGFMCIIKTESIFAKHKDPSRYDPSILKTNGMPYLPYDLRTPKFNLQISIAGSVLFFAALERKGHNINIKSCAICLLKVKFAQKCWNFGSSINHYHIFVRHIRQQTIISRGQRNNFGNNR